MSRSSAATSDASIALLRDPSACLIAARVMAVTEPSIRACCNAAGCLAGAVPGAVRAVSVNRREDPLLELEPACRPYRRAIELGDGEAIHRTTADALRVHADDLQPRK